MDRRKALKTLGAAGLPLAGGRTAAAGNSKEQHPDVIVVGAGVFGVWAAYKLRQAGQSVLLVDAVHPAHAAASSGGESRVTRSGYGDAELYSEWSFRSISEWQQLSNRASLPLYHETGVLWLHSDADEYVTTSRKVLDKLAIPHEQYGAKQLRQLFPVMRLEPDEFGFFEPRAGALMARRAVQTLAAELQTQGVAVTNARIEPVLRSQSKDGALPFLRTTDGQMLMADKFVLACGPWLDKVCPDAMAGRLFVTRQDVLYFAHDAAAARMPVWADLPYYGIPGLEGRGFKVADDRHGEVIDPDTVERLVTAEAETAVREFLGRRFPSLAEQPILESRVCQYENSSNGDFIIDFHPGFDNVVIAGGGSGHGFKHGPAVGTHIAGLLLGSDPVIERFSLASKSANQQRVIQ